MKNKKLSYVLAPVVILVWGLIFYKLFFSTNNGIIVADKTKKQKKVNEYKAENNNFALLVDYRDPFLSGIEQFEENQDLLNQQEQQNNLQQQIKKTPEPKPQKIVLFPNVQYRGMIKNKTDKRTLAVLVFQGKEKLVSSGESYNDVRVKRIYADSLVIVYESVVKTIYKK